MLCEVECVAGLRACVTVCEKVPPASVLGETLGLVPRGCGAPSYVPINEDVHEGLVRPN